MLLTQYQRDAGFSLENVWENTLGDGSSSGLLSVQDRFIDVKVPLAGLGATDAANVRIDLEEADSIVRVLGYAVAPFGSAKNLGHG